MLFMASPENFTESSIAQFPPRVKRKLLAATRKSQKEKEGFAVCGAARLRDVGDTEAPPLDSASL